MVTKSNIIRAKRRKRRSSTYVPTQPSLPEGVKIITKEGTFVVRDGEFVSVAGKQISASGIARSLGHTKKSLVNFVKTVGKTGPVGGIVKTYLAGSAIPKFRNTAFSNRPPNDIIVAIRAGLPFDELSALQTGLDISLDQLAPRLGMSMATLHRRKDAGRLDRQESDRVIRFARILRKALEVFGTADYARQWLSSPQVGLDGSIPLDYAETELGAREVEDLLVRIDHGVYS